MVTHHRLWILSCFVACVSASCSTENAAYDPFIGNENVLSPCKGYCAGSEHLSELACSEGGGTWHEASCRSANGTILEDISSESQCKTSPSPTETALSQENYWTQAYCEFKQEQCNAAGLHWGAYEIEDMGNGQFIRHKEDKYYCGSYNAIMEETAGECDAEVISQYREDFSLNLCKKNLKCQGAYYQGERKVAICNSCDDARALCPASGDVYQCVDLASDPLNCGACSNTCGDGAFCANGECKQELTTTCTKEQIRCSCSEIDGKRECKAVASNEQILRMDEYCLDPLDSATCGITSCEDLADEEKLKTTQCTAGWQCVMAQQGQYACKCAEGSFLLDGKCVWPTSSEYCGISQDNASHPLKCVTDKSACNGKSCVCVSPYYLCGESGNGDDCVDVLSDSAHCGGCGMKCPEGEECANGQCQCPEGEIRCDGKCIDPLTNMDYCGARGNCTNDNDSEANNSETNNPEESNPEGNRSEDDNTNHKPLNSAGVRCKNSISCNNGECECGKNAFKMGDECILTSDKRYCGAKKDEDGNRGQDCMEIQYGKCSVVINSYKCACEDKDENGNDLLPAYKDGTILEKCVNPKTDEYCGYRYDKNGVAVYEDCTAKSEGLVIWTCQEQEQGKDKNWECQAGCPKDFIECVQDCGDGTGNKCTYCLKDDEVEYSNEETKTCICRTCDDDDNPVTGCSGVSSGGSLDHCTGCKQPCAPHFRVCKGVTSTTKPYVCACGENEKEVTFSEKDQNGFDKACLNTDDAHIEMGASGFWQCKAPWINVDNDWSNGCEVDTSSDNKYCGDNRTDCMSLNHVGLVTCQKGVCQVQSCQGGFGNCDQKAENGCETDVKTDVSNCNACNVTCSRKCQNDQSSCDSQCNEGICCQIGEFDGDYDANALNCCEGTKLYLYEKKGFWIFAECTKREHYGCFEQNPDEHCWTEVK